MPGEGRTLSTRAGDDGGCRNPGPGPLVLDLLLLRCRPGGEDVCISSLRHSQSGASRGSRSSPALTATRPVRRLLLS